jgi:hypothetical protein
VFKRNEVHPFVVTASAYVGYTARPNANDFLAFSRVTGEYQWDGSFVDVVSDKTVTAGLLPKHANTTSALSFYTRNGWTRRAPKAGDLVFYTAPVKVQASRYLSPRIGIVTSAKGWRVNGTFRAIEAQTYSGLPRAPKELNGVYERTRYSTDVISFVRIPKKIFYKTENGETVLTPTDAHTVRPAHLERCSSAKKTASAKSAYRQSTELVQLALAEHPACKLRNADRFVFNGVTRSALASFQRFCGFPAYECDGSPNPRTLEQLSHSPYTTRKFSVEP